MEMTAGWLSLIYTISNRLLTSLSDHSLFNFFKVRNPEFPLRGTPDFYVSGQFCNFKPLLTQYFNYPNNLINLL